MIMDILEIMITPLIGAVIGYFTNWIAIRMLFRPHREKYLFGIRLPFTPGLIPKERAVLAQKVGEATAQYVLTDEVLSASLLSDEMNEKLTAMLDDAFIRLRQNERTIGDVLALVNIDWTDGGGEAIDAYLTGKLTDQLQKEEIKTAAAEYMTEGILRFLASPQSVMNPEGIFDALKGIVDTKGKELLRSEEFADKIRSYVATAFQNLADSEKLFSDVIPDTLMQGLVGVIQSNMTFAGDALEKLFDENPAMEEKLRQMIHNLANENFGRLLGIFINYDKIYDNLKRNLLRYLSDGQNQEILVAKLTDGLNRIMASDVKSVLARMPEDFDRDIAEKLVGFAQNPDRDADIDKLLAFLQNKLIEAEQIDIYQLILKIEPAFPEKLQSAVYSVVDNSLVPGLTDIVAEKLPTFRQKLMAVKINDLIGGLSEESEAKAKTAALSAIKTVLANGGAYVVQNIDIGRMIEDRINDFEVEQAEKIIVSVVSKELNAITWLGGLLGLIIGFVPVVTNLIRG